MSAEPDQELQDYRATLVEIRDHVPTCTPESDDAWANRVWAGLFRDLQRKAREALRKHGL